LRSKPGWQPCRLPRLPRGVDFRRRQNLVTRTDPGPHRFPTAHTSGRRLRTKNSKLVRLPALVAPKDRQLDAAGRPPDPIGSCRAVPRPGCLMHTLCVRTQVPQKLGTPAVSPLHSRQTHRPQTGKHQTALWGGCLVCSRPERASRSTSSEP
jgi:hypothetical protein